MREIVSLFIGGCGNRIGNCFWKGIMREHNIDTNTGERIEGFEDVEENLNIFLDEREDKFVPRVVMADLEAETIESMIKNENLLESKFASFQRCGNGNCFSRGMYTDGALLIRNIMDQARKSVEQCDFFEGFQMFHSIIGGSGSGLGSLVVSKLREEFPDKMMATATVLPSNKDDYGSRSLSHYNAGLSMHYLVENTDFVTCLNNEALGNICNSKLGLENYGYEHMNNLITQAICGFTSPLRFSGILNSSYRKLSTNLVPFPRLHFFTVSHSPFCLGDTEPTVEGLTSDVFNQTNLLISMDPSLGRYMTNIITYRDNEPNISMIEEYVRKFKKDNEAIFKEWVPNNIHTSVCKSISPDCPTKSSATMVSNTSAIKTVFNKISDQFTVMFRRRAFLHQYLEDGMDEMEFTEAESNFNDLQSEYYDDWGAWCEEEEEGEYDEEP
ncbi:beta-tubulin [Naegleria gruberi]|uniref:Beta-tubulin n=1 Tax=Naegleria gruberi TaxID=5762 RepID=D2VYW1_NAEGR|nr:beta-tubulin [Naegleria gruberi]EFC37980.1 beta-tubulin [Naegleria gruberi]|eukprot:XP_002670724.1 beta-tubulin [Naegleria gruberi]